ncbi:hypothetical protein N431DRAFT_543466 [Stipitochalara longipes BDJ]|nr:hypothetical protein N431DRAFT_543466 [Stipitochalara longipes BDJ]
MSARWDIAAYIVKKPHRLALNDTYIQTDVHSLKAFLLLTTDICRSCETLDAVTLLEIQRYRGLITLHLPSSSSTPINTQLTKFEIDRMIEGYPPFYREHFTTTGGITLPFPTTHTDHIQRGAWVLSVGMTTSSGPTPHLYNMQRIRQENSDVYWRGTHVLAAFYMIGRTLAQLRAYEESEKGHPRLNQTNHSWSQDALTCFDMIMTTEYSSQPWALKKEQLETSDIFKTVMGDCPCYSTCIGGADHSVTCGRNQHKQKTPAKALNKEQCIAALEIFQNYQHKEQNLQIIWPVLPEVLQCLVLGMSEVEHYFAYRGQKLEVPKEVVEQRYIYLRRCSKDAS